MNFSVSKPSRVSILLLTSILFGALLRFVNLDAMIYWGDEVYSSIRIFGYTTQEIYRSVTHGQVVTALTLQQFQQIGTQQNLGDTIHTLAIEDAHITPLYFLLARLWAGILGSSIVSIRSFSTICGVALLPAVYWLAIELFQHRRIALCSTALVAVSPVQLLFAQEARMYALWTLLMVIAGATLLRAIRCRSWASWLLFAVATSASLYTHFLAAIPLAGYGFYTIVLHYRDRQIQRRFYTATSLAILSFCPWIWVFLTRQVVEQEDGTQRPFSLIEAVKNWFSLFRRVFIDVNTTLQSSFGAAVTLLVISLFCFALVSFALIQLQRETPIRIWLFVGLLTFGLPISLFGQSLHGVLPSRYLLPSCIGLQLAIGYLLGQRLSRRRLSCNRARQTRWFGKTSSPPPHGQHRWIWTTSLVALVIIGIISCATNVQAETWWNKGFSECNPTTAKLVNQSVHPIVISDGTGGPFFDHALSNIISLARLVKPDTAFQIALEPNPQAIARGEFSDRFIFTPSKNLREQLQQTYGANMQPRLKLTHPYRGSDVCLWQIIGPD
ncbi:MAG: hypothetical protein HC805_05680 [Alkalinema sp. RL_2_19]|nr:hypothetical protein [Alkalinema sp. RL_2_19]